MSLRRNTSSPVDYAWVDSVFTHHEADTHDATPPSSAAIPEDREEVARLTSPGRLTTSIEPVTASWSFVNTVSGAPVSVDDVDDIETLFEARDLYVGRSCHSDGFDTQFMERMCNKREYDSSADDPSATPSKRLCAEHPLEQGSTSGATAGTLNEQPDNAASQGVAWHHNVYLNALPAESKGYIPLAESDSESEHGQASSSAATASSTVPSVATEQAPPPPPLLAPAMEQALVQPLVAQPRFVADIVDILAANKAAEDPEVNLHPTPNP